MGPFGDVFFFSDPFDFSSFLPLSFSTIIGRKKEAINGFLFTAAKRLQLQNQKGERKSGESTNISEKAVAEKIFVIELEFAGSCFDLRAGFLPVQSFFFILKLSILLKHQHGLPFLHRAQCVLKPGHDKKNIIEKQICKERQKICITGR